MFVQVLQVARENQLSRFGSVSLDGTKIHGNASRHSALSWGHAEAIEAQLKREVQALLALAEQADGANLPEGMNIPAELARREQRLAAIAAAKTKIAARAAERHAREQADYEAKLAARAAKAAATGKPARGKAPTPPQPGPRPSDQVNLTDEESRIMPVAGGGFEQCYNAQAIVDSDTMLVVVPSVTQAANDKQPLVPMLQRLQALPQGLNQPEQLSADAGYCSTDNVVACEQAGIEPLIAVGRDQHHPHFAERFTEPGALPESATPVQRMTHRLKTRAGRAAYAPRKQSVEPVFGIIKSVLGQLLSSLPAVWTTCRTSGRWSAWRGTSSAWRFCARSKGKGKETCAFDPKSVSFLQTSAPRQPRGRRAGAKSDRLLGRARTRKT